MHVAPYVDDDGMQLTPARSFPYDTLVLAIGSHTNDFGTPGVKEHAIRLETVKDADRFHRLLVNACIRANAQPEPLREEQLDIAIIGAGATGVELAAELHNMMRQLIDYGLDRIDAERDVRIHLIEAAPRILPGLPPPMSEATAKQLAALGIKLHVSSKVSEVLAHGVKLSDGKIIPAEMIVWAAGVKAHDRTKEFGLDTNRINQIAVRPTLQTIEDDNIFALGDCAACAWAGKDSAFVPPRAQAAHQQASHVYKQILRRLAGKPLEALRLPGLRIAGVDQRVFDGRQPDGRRPRRQSLLPGLSRAPHVHVAAQDARPRAARLLEGRPRHARRPHQPPHGDARQAALKGSTDTCPRPTTTPRSSSRTS